MIAMDETELKRKISKIKVWKKADQKAPNKPLLLLLALTKLLHRKNEFSYEEVREKMLELLAEYNHTQGKNRADHPFVRLQKDGIWRLSKVVDTERYSDELLRSENIKGGFSSEVLKLLWNNDKLIQDVINQLLQEHFHPSLHQKLLRDVGFLISLP